MINQKNGENVVDKKGPGENRQGSANEAYNGEVNAVEASNLCKCSYWPIVKIFTKDRSNDGLN